MSKGVFLPNSETRLVYEYSSLKTLKKLGFSFDASKLTDFDVLIFGTIDDELAKIEREEIKKPRKK